MKGKRLFFAVGVIALFIFYFFYLKPNSATENISGLNPDNFAKYPDLKQFVVNLQKFKKEHFDSNASTMNVDTIFQNLTYIQPYGDEEKTAQVPQDYIDQLVRILRAVLREKPNKLYEQMLRVKDSVDDSELITERDISLFKEFYNDYSENYQLTYFLQISACPLLSVIGRRGMAALPELMSIYTDKNVPYEVRTAMVETIGCVTDARTIPELCKEIKSIKPAIGFSSTYRTVIIQEDGTMFLRYFQYTGNSAELVIGSSDSELRILFNDDKWREKVNREAQLFYASSLALMKIADDKTEDKLLISQYPRIRAAVVIGYLRDLTQKYTKRKFERIFRVLSNDKNLLVRCAAASSLDDFYFHPKVKDIQKLFTILHREKSPAVRACIVYALRLRPDLSYKTLIEILENKKETPMIRRIALDTFSSRWNSNRLKEIHFPASLFARLLAIANDEENLLLLRNCALVAAAKMAESPDAVSEIVKILRQYIKDKHAVSSSSIFLCNVCLDTIKALHHPAALPFLQEIVDDKMINSHYSAEASRAIKRIKEEVIKKENGCFSSKEVRK